MRIACWVPLSLTLACGPSVVDEAPSPAESTTFRVAFLADPHIIGDDYVCCESRGVDTDSIYRTRARLSAVVDTINAMDPQPELVMVAGDIVHQAYKGTSVDDYLQPGSAFSVAQELFGRLEPEVHLALGNHDYDVPDVPASVTHELFRTTFGTEPYHAVDRGGFRFLLTNSQLGPTWDRSDPMSAFFDTGVGSFGREQLAWMADQLADGVPTFVMFHHPLYVVATDEDPEGPWPDVFAVLETYRDVLQGVYVGHTHLWLDGTSGFDLPFYVLGGVRYDADNFWVHEFQRDGSGWTALDTDKADWGTRFGWPSTYEGGEVAIDLGVPAADDVAGGWNGVETIPEVWPPAE